MIDFSETKQGLLFKEPETIEEVTLDSDGSVLSVESVPISGKYLELKKTSTALTEPENSTKAVEKPKRRKFKLPGGASPVDLMCCLGVTAALIGGFTVTVNGMVHGQREMLKNIDSWSDTLVMADNIDTAAKGLPSSTEVSATFEGTDSTSKKATVSYESSTDGKILKTAKVFGMDGRSYEISGTVAHYTIDFTVAGDGADTSYSYDSKTDKVSELKSKEL